MNNKRKCFVIIILGLFLVVSVTSLFVFSAIIFKDNDNKLLKIGYNEDEILEIKP